MGHGIRIYEQATSLLPPRSVSSALPVVFGTAPLNMGKAENVNKPVLCYSYEDAVEEFGYLDDYANYTLCEMMYVYFVMYGCKPVVFVNVLDPATHKTDVTDSAVTLADGKVTIPETGILKDTIVVKDSGGTTTYVLNTDYTVAFDSGGYIEIKKIDTGSIASNDITVSYSKLDPSAVVKDDIIGGIDATTGDKTGLELVSEVFTRFRMVPGSLLAPGWSHNVDVAALMAAKAENINGLFRCVAIADIQDVSVEKYSDIPAFKQQNSLIDEDLLLCWPKTSLGEKDFWMSTQVAGVMASTDADNEDVPYVSPSNKNFVMDRAIYNGQEVWLTNDEATYLNENGIVTALNFMNGWVCWGNRTAAYPDITDVKDTFIPIRRMFSWIGNTIVLTYWQRVDFPIRRRFIATIVDSIQFWLNGLASREIILGGRISFLEEENPVTDIMNGIIRFHLHVTPPSPAEDIRFILEYDPEYLQALFG